MKRKLTQLITAVLYNSHLSGFLNGRIYKGKLKGVCTPGLNCYSCPGAVAACPLGSFQGAIAKSAYKLPIYMLGMLLLSGILFGRFICGFLCPFGLLQELISIIPSPKINKNKATRILSYLKYVMLAVFVLLIPLLTMDPGFCKYICPAGTLEAGIPFFILDEGVRAVTGVLFSWKIIVLLFIIIICLFLYRGFCRFLCPLGAIYSFFNPVSFSGVGINKEKCTDCGICISKCRMDISRIGDSECIQCMECTEFCPEDAVTVRGLLRGKTEKSGKLFME
ncbi:MAG: 4Fe-4S binding protein [Lachnospiraceae bacterium]|nr:4Fe-4S binding protein [Lachnospiraceae bacterium]